MWLLKQSYAIAVAAVHAQCNLAVNISSQHVGLETTAGRTKKIQSRKGIDMIGLTRWRDDKISELEDTLESYRLRNKQLEGQLSELNELKLKCKIQQMLIDDDPAIDELLECSKKNKTVQVRHDYGNAMAQQTRMSLSNQQMASQRQYEYAALALSLF